MVPKHTTGLTLDGAGNVWVADTRNHRLQKFDANGKFLGVIGTPGRGKGQFITPSWVSFEAGGAYYVAETNSAPDDLAAADIQNQRIQKFAADGTFLLEWGALGADRGQFRFPMMVAVDAMNHAYVSDYYNTRVQKFDLSASPGAPIGPVTPPGSPAPPIPAPAGSRFVNLSARLRTNDVETSRAFIAGFVVSGSAPKPVLVRAVGPGLAGFGVPGALANPRLRVFAGEQLVAQNEDWADAADLRAAGNRAGAFGLLTGSRDAALLLMLAPGAYSAHVASNGGDGVALVEVYDLDPVQPGAQLINLSTRGFVDRDDGVLVAGFVVGGDAPKRVLVRGIGSALTNFGVTGVLADPVLRVHRGNTVVAQNDNWETSELVAGGPPPAGAAEIMAAAGAAGAFALPAGSRDAALLVTLQPGAYSAIVSGAASSTGAGLVEVYEVP